MTRRGAGEIHDQFALRLGAEELGDRVVNIVGLRREFFGGSTEMKLPGFEVVRFGGICCLLVANVCGFV